MGCVGVSRPGQHGAGPVLVNKGACLVNGGTLAVMNNLHVPVGLLLNLLIWNQHEPLGRLALGGLVIVGAVWITRLDSARRQSIA